MSENTKQEAQEIAKTKSPEVLLRFEKVSKRYQDKTALDQVSFDIEKGEFVTILGTSGSGKTTALKLMNRLLEPSSGSISFKDQMIAQVDAVSLRRQMGYVVQNIGLFPHLTVAENIATVPKLLGWKPQKIKERTQELLDLVQLPYADFAQRYPNQLSGGQQQRVGVARALAANPEVMLFDEPFGAIDAITRGQLQDELVALHRSLADKTFVFITHDIYEAFKLGTKVMIMDQGRVLQYARPKEIFKNPQGDFVQSLLRTAREQEKIWEALDD